MKILILGATGRTGKLIIEAALHKGHQVVAIARNPKILDFQGIDIQAGTPYDFATVEKAIAGCDAVINTLNVSRKSDNPWSPLAAPKDLISVSASNALRAMEKAGVKRFVALSTIGAGRSWKSSPFVLKLIVTLSNLKYAFSDQGRQEALLENSPVDYTICRSPMLTNEIIPLPAIATPESQPPKGMKLSRKSAAEFFINILENNLYIRQTVNLSNG
jgi:putative NADH-flavin reductase